jgi:hypothetical protein
MDMPASSTKGYIINWQESPYFENLVRSVFIDKTGRMSEPVNVYKHSGQLVTIFTCIINDIVYFYIIDGSSGKLLLKKIPVKSYHFVNSDLNGTLEK